jgi:MFS family permease
MVGLVGMTLAVHQPRLVVDLGFTLRLSALLFGTLGLMRTVGGLIWGPLSDRIGRTPCIWIITVISVLGFLGLLSVGRVPADWSVLRISLLWAFTVTFGIGFNGLTPIYASAVADRFGGPSLGTMFGLLDLGFGLGAAIGPWVAGEVYDLVSSYTLVLWGCIAAMVVSGVALIYLGEHRAPVETA